MRFPTYVKFTISTLIFTLVSLPLFLSPGSINYSVHKSRDISELNRWNHVHQNTEERMEGGILWGLPFPNDGVEIPWFL